MDELNLSDVEIKTIYLEKLRDEKSEIENLEDPQQMEQMMEFVLEVNKEEFELTLVLELKYDICKAFGQLLRR